MTGSGLLVETLKQILKSKGITYKDLAAKWRLSEASVKRIMSAGDLSLDRLESACELMGMTFAGLVKQTPFELEAYEQTMPAELEEEFAKNLRLFHYWNLLLDGLTPRQIERKFVVSSAESQKFLLRLDRLGLLELHPKNRVKLLERERRFLRKDGPIGRLILQYAKTTFLESSFKNSLMEHLRFASYRLSPQSALRYKTKIDKIIHDMRNESEVEGRAADSVEFGFFAAFRPATSAVVEPLEPRKGSENSR